MDSDSTMEADTNTDLMPGLLKQPNLTLELFPNHSENLETAKKVNVHVAVSGLWAATISQFNYLIKGK